MKPTTEPVSGLFIQKAINGWIVEQREPYNPSSPTCSYSQPYVFNDIERLQNELPALLGIYQAAKAAHAPDPDQVLWEIEKEKERAKHGIG